MQFPIGSQVKLRGYTGDDQIDYYIGQTLIVTTFQGLPYEVPFEKGKHSTIPNYTLLTPDDHIISANEDELEAAE